MERMDNEFMERNPRRKRICTFLHPTKPIIALLRRDKRSSY